LSPSHAASDPNRFGTKRFQTQETEIIFSFNEGNGDGMLHRNKSSELQNARVLQCLSQCGIIIRLPLYRELAIAELQLARDASNYRHTNLPASTGTDSNQSVCISSSASRDPNLSTNGRNIQDHMKLEHQRNRKSSSFSADMTF
jgi:hypothetical protein